MSKTSPSATTSIAEAADAIKSMMVGEHLFSCINGSKGNAPSDSCAAGESK